MLTGYLRQALLNAAMNPRGFFLFPITSISHFFIISKNQLLNDKQIMKIKISRQNEISK
jgi:hypothetical protein